MLKNVFIRFGCLKAVNDWMKKLIWSPLAQKNIKINGRNVYYGVHNKDQNLEKGIDKPIFKLIK